MEYLSVRFLRCVAAAQAKILGPEDVYVKKGSTISLTCTVNVQSTPPSSVSWHHGAAVVDFDSPRYKPRESSSQFSPPPSSFLMYTRFRSIANAPPLPSHITGRGSRLCFAGAFPASTNVERKPYLIFRVATLRYRRSSGKRLAISPLIRGNPSVRKERQREKAGGGGGRERERRESKKRATLDPAILLGISSNITSRGTKIAYIHSCFSLSLSLPFPLSLSLCSDGGKARRSHCQRLIQRHS